MEDYGWIVIIVGVIVLVIGGIIFAVVAEKKRREQISKVAEELSLQFFEGKTSMFGGSGDAAPLQAQMASFKLFSQGRGRHIRNMIYGDAAGTELAIFDYQYTTGSGKHSHTWRQSVMYMKGSDVMLPQFIARPENFFDKVGSVLGFKDIDFDEHPEFSKAFKLVGNNETAIRQLFTAELMDFFMQHRDMTIEAAGNQMVYYRPQRRVKPPEIKDFMQDGFAAFSQLKDAAAQAGGSS